MDASVINQKNGISLATDLVQDIRQIVEEASHKQKREGIHSTVEI